MNRIDATISVAGSGSEQAHPSASGFAGLASGDGVRLHVPAMSESSLPDSHSGTTITNLEGLVETAENDAICGICHVRLGDHSHINNACPRKADSGLLFHQNQFFTRFVPVVVPPYPGEWR